MTETASAARSQNCQWCGTIHGGVCPKVLAIEYFENGNIKRVEFKSEPQWMPSYYPPQFPWRGNEIT